jgi:hypothetical protein
MNGIIKRRKTSNFAQIQNHPLQTLADIRATGVLAHLMSMPDNWVIRKTHLYSKYGRGPISSGIALLEKLGYWVHLSYRDGRENIHLYHLSDVAFTESEVEKMIFEVEKTGFKVKHISEPFHHLLLTQNEGQVDPFSTVDFQQLNFNSPFSTVENRQLLNKDRQKNKEQINRNQRNIVNLQQASPFLEGEDFKQALATACHEHYPQFAPGRWSKQAWQTLIESFVEETYETGRFKNISGDNIHSYAHASILNMVHSFDCKTGRKTIRKIIPNRPVPFYDWVSGTSEEEPIGTF